MKSMQPDANQNWLTINVQKIALSYPCLLIMH